jgi:hypothetical protein
MTDQAARRGLGLDLALDQAPPRERAPAVERFAELEAGDRKELERAHRLEVVAHLRFVLASCDRGTSFEEGDGIAAGLETAVFELEHWPPAAGIE